jgi:hypothetical protein
VNAKNLKDMVSAGKQHDEMPKPSVTYQILRGKLGDSAIHLGDLCGQRLNKRLKVFLCRAEIGIMR